MQCVLHLSDPNKKEEFEYISNLIVGFMGVNSQVEIIQDSRTYLNIEKQFTLNYGDLLRLFNVVTLNREVDLPNDIHGRMDQNFINWEISTPTFNNYIFNINNTNNNSGKDKFKVIFTHDIDWVNGNEIYSIYKSLRRSNKWISFKQAIDGKVFFDEYVKITELEKKYNISTWNFMLAGPHRFGRYSSRYDSFDKNAQRFIQFILDSDNNLGLHGSYKAYENNNYRSEKERLSKASGINIIAHRNHYLRFSNYSLWDQLEQANIHYDFSVGYPSKMGFRAGICNLYKPFNSIKRSESTVNEIPLIYMDRDKHIENVESTTINLKKILEEVKKYNGCVSLLFHPESFVIDKRWFKFYENVIKLVIDMKADVSGVLP